MTRSFLSITPWLAVPGPLAALLVAGLTLGAATARAEGQGRPPLPVATMTLERVEGYPITDRFIGRLEPARQTSLAFERGGLVAQVLVTEGAQVAAGDIVARLDDEQLTVQRERLRAQRAQVVAELELANRTLDRQRTLRSQGHAADQRYDEARLNAAALAGRLAEVEAAIRATEIDIDRSVLRAPFAGTIGARLLDEGAVVAAGAPLADLLESGRPQARIGLSPEAASALSVGGEVALVAAGRSFPARVTALRPDLDTATRTVTALLTPEAPLPLAFGDVVELRLERAVAAPGAWVPVSALVEGRRGLWTLFLLDGDGADRRAARESVEVLHMAGDRAFVRGPITDGTMVVAAGAHRIVPGQPVVPATAVAAE